METHRTSLARAWCPFPQGPCTQIAYTSAPKYLKKDYFKAKVYTIWVQDPRVLKTTTTTAKPIFGKPAAHQHICTSSKGPSTHYLRTLGPVWVPKTLNKDYLGFLIKQRSVKLDQSAISIRLT